MVNRLTIRISSSNMMPNLNLHSHGEHGWDLIMKRMEEWGLHHQNFMDRMELGPEPGGLVQQKKTIEMRNTSWQRSPNYPLVN